MRKVKPKMKPRGAPLTPERARELAAARWGRRDPDVGSTPPTTATDPLSAPRVGDRARTEAILGSPAAPVRRPAADLGEFRPAEVADRVKVVVGKRRSLRLTKVASSYVDRALPPAEAARVAERDDLVARLRLMTRAERDMYANASRRMLGRPEYPPVLPLHAVASTEAARSALALTPDAARALDLDGDLLPRESATALGLDEELMPPAPAAARVEPPRVPEPAAQEPAPQADLFAPAPQVPLIARLCALCGERVAGHEALERHYPERHADDERRPHESARWMKVPAKRSRR